MHGGWALFQWTQLVAARSGGEPFCGLGDGATCTEIWDSSFAGAVQAWTGVPIAGWGLVWSLAAFALPLLALTDRASPGEPGSTRAAMGSAWAATLWMAIGGLAAVALLSTVSVISGGLCTTCVVTYTLVASYAATCFVQTPPRTVALGKGLSLAAGALAVAFVLLFVPGLRTPMSQSAEGREALARAGSAPVAPSSSEAETPEDPARAAIAKLLGELPTRMLQVMSDELHRYATASPVPLRPPRALVGSPDAPVRFTTFTDVLCSHCANLHDTLEQLRTALPEGAFSLESRHFPLDPGCNPSLHGESRAPVRCLAARAEICAEGRPGAFELAGRLYVNQRSLDEEGVYTLAEPILSRPELRACVADPKTDARLRDDIAWATEHHIHGTPLVLLNGRPVASFGPLLYALVLTKGDPDDPAFARLPPPQVEATDDEHGHPPGGSQ